MAGSIYVVTNNINKKKYVGQTLCTVKKRIKQHSYSKSSLLGKALTKYGINNFTIQEYLDIRKEWLDWAEIELIKKYNCITPNGYNITSGGQLRREGTFRWTDEQKEKLSKIRQKNHSKYDGMSGKKHSEETKKKMSESAKKVFHNTEWNKNVSIGQLGKIIKQETRDKIAKEHMIKNRKCKDIKILCVETGQTFDFQREACDAYGIERTALGNCLSGINKTSGKMHWEYLEVN